MVGDEAGQIVFIVMTALNVREWALKFWNGDRRPLTRLERPYQRVLAAV